MAAITVRPCPTPISFVIRCEPGRCVLAVSGELDASSSPLLDDAVTAALQAVDALTVDLRLVTFADWRGVSPLIRAADTAADRGKRLTVRNWPPSVDRIAEAIPTVRQVFGDSVASRGA
jgi:anti-anti-sigma factor